MADNIDVTAGSGTTVHADEYTHSTLGSGKTQLVKLVDGTLDSSTAITAGGGVEAGALRVTIASDSTGVLSIDDNGGAITVDGTVTANLSATDNAVLDAIAVDTAALVVDAAASEVLLGTIDADTSTIAGDTTSIDGKITACNTGAVVISANTDSIDGAGAPVIDSYASAAVNLAADTANQSVVAAPGANKQIWVYGLVGTVDVAGSISIQDEDDTALSGVMPVGITGGFVMNPCGNFAMPWIKVATNKALEIDTVTCTFDGIVTYAIVSV